MQEFTAIKTARCTIRAFRRGDLDAFTRYRNNAAWMEFQGFKGLTKRAYAKELLGRHSFEEGVQLAVADAETDALLGDIFLKRTGDAWWMGYTVDPQHARRGYAYEAAAAVVGWLRQAGAARVNAGALPGNTASLHLLEKLGFSYIKTDENGERIYTLPLV